MYQTFFFFASYGIIISGCRSSLHWEIEKRRNRYKGVSHELNLKLEKLYDEAKDKKELEIMEVPDSELKVY